LFNHFNSTKPTIIHHLFNDVKLFLKIKKVCSIILTQLSQPLYIIFLMMSSFFLKKSKKVCSIILTQLSQPLYIIFLMMSSFFFKIIKKSLFNHFNSTKPTIIHHLFNDVKLFF